MKAIIYSRFGSPDVLRAEEQPRPVPGDRQILVKVHATSASSADWRARTKEIAGAFRLLAPFVFGFSRPSRPILGTELSGEVVAVGTGVTRFAVGDRVFAHTGGRYGCYVEYKCFDDDGPVARMPDGLSYEEAATVSFGGVAALAFLAKAKIQPGEHVLVNGAAGATGTAAVQLAKHYGATVTAVCSADGAELVATLGADHVIDYRRDDFTRRRAAYDVIVDTVGTAGWRRSRRALRPGGRLVAIAGTLGDILLAPWVALATSKRLIAGAPTARWTDRQVADALEVLADLSAIGAFRSVIDRRYDLARIVEAHAYVDGGHKHGNVAITVAA